MKVEHEDETVQLPAGAVEPEYKPTKQAGLAGGSPFLQRSSWP